MFYPVMKYECFLEPAALSSMDATLTIFTKVLMSEKLLMEEGDLERIVVMQSCFTDGDTLAVKFGSMEDIKRTYKYKNNIPAGFSSKLFV